MCALISGVGLLVREAGGRSRHLGAAVQTCESGAEGIDYVREVLENAVHVGHVATLWPLWSRCREALSGVGGVGRPG